MRKLLRFSIGFSVACAASGLLLWQKNVTMLIVFSFLCSIFCSFLQRNDRRLKEISLILLGLGVGFFWCALYHGFYLAPLERLDGETVHLYATATDYSEETMYGYSVDAVITVDGRPYSIRVYQKENFPVEPGTAVEADFSIRLTTPNMKKDSAYYRSSGYFAIATQKTAAKYTKSSLPAAFFLPARFSRSAQQSINRFFPLDTASFAKAILLGDTSDLSYETDTALKTSGIRHVVAVSGLHISSLFAVIYLLFRKNRWMTFFASVIILPFFAAATGFSPSVMRAVLMAGLMSLGMALEEEYDGLTSLSFAAFVMMILNPFVVCSVSFQLSVSSVAGILILTPVIYKKMKKHFSKINPKSKMGKLLFWFCGAISVSMGAQLFSLPFSAYYFGSISLVGPLTNLLIIWIIPVLFCGIAVVGILGGILPGLCQILGLILSWPIRFVLKISKFLSHIPFAAVYTQSAFIVAWVVFFYCLFIIFILTRRKLRVCFFLTCIAFFAAIAASILIPKQDTLRLHVLDVGEGQAILLQNKGSTYLIDCGGSSDTKAADEIAQTLLSQGTFKLDGLILTHYDSDHCNALEYLLTRISVEAFYLPVQGRGDLAESLESRYTDRINWLDSLSSLKLATGTLTFFPSEASKISNENSVCILFESEECVILITGDRSRTGEKELLRKYLLPDVDILVAGHHGSQNATSPELLQAVRPELVIISAGANNRYGHPSQETLNRLSDFGCKIFRTDLQGAVLVRR